MNALVQCRRGLSLLLWPLLVVSAMLFAETADAADIKTLSGASCQPYNGSVASDFRIRGAGIYNATSVDRDIACGLVIDAESLTQLTVTVYLNTPVMSTAQCTLEWLGISENGPNSPYVSSPVLYLRRPGDSGGTRPYTFSGIYVQPGQPVMLKCRLGPYAQLSYIRYSE